MDRTERFYKIEALIRSRGCISFADLLEALEVSPATLKRDLALEHGEVPPVESLKVLHRRPLPRYLRA